MALIIGALIGIAWVLFWLAVYLIIEDLGK
jgi:hypothetical protein